MMMRRGTSSDHPPRSSLVETLDHWEIQMTAEFLSSFDVLLLRASCALCAASIAIIIHTSKHMHDEHSLNWMPKAAAKGTDPVRGRNICILVREWARRWARETQSKTNSTTEAGSSIPLDFHWMLSGAARGGHRDLCILACGWACETYDPIMDFGCMLCNAVRCADPVRGRELCILAREWGAIHFNWMLEVATKNDKRELCILAREWIRERNVLPLKYNRMLHEAAWRGYRDICVLAREWLDTAGIKPDFDGMFDLAANGIDGGHRDICELARKWEREWIQKEPASDPLGRSVPPGT